MTKQITTTSSDRKPNALLWLHHLLRVVLALLFIWAGVVKLVYITNFARSLGEFGVVLDTLVLPAAWTICLLEVVAGLSLAANVRGSLALLLLLLLTFIGVLAYGIALGLHIDCGCLGPGYRVGLRVQLLIDIGFVLWCGAIYWTRRQCRLKPLDLVDYFRRVLN